MSEKLTYMGPAETWQIEPTETYFKKSERALEIVKNIGAIQLAGRGVQNDINKESFDKLTQNLMQEPRLEHWSDLGALSDYIDYRRVTNAGFAFADVGKGKLLIPIFNLVIQNSPQPNFFVVHPTGFEDLTSVDWLWCGDRIPWRQHVDNQQSAIEPAVNTWIPSSHLYDSTLRIYRPGYDPVVTQDVYDLTNLKNQGIERLLRGNYYYFNPFSDN